MYIKYVVASDHQTSVKRQSFFNFQRNPSKSTDFKSLLLKSWDISQVNKLKIKNRNIKPFKQDTTMFITTSTELKYFRNFN